MFFFLCFDWLNLVFYKKLKFFVCLVIFVDYIYFKIFFEYFDKKIFGVGGG